ncbi:Uncharacterised protein [Bordetella pertussis]|nr:Uncharacterised protein [Bordetella pertussis]
MPHPPPQTPKRRLIAARDIAQSTQKWVTNSSRAPQSAG